MSFHNPTQIRLGMSGAFFNRNYRVIGRAVLGVMEGGQAYYWNEFYLQSGGGAAATLVFEETEGGCAWRLFTMFDASPPMTAAEAETKREGDAVNLDGAYLHVTRVDHSQVYCVEGKTPEGIETGKVAHYFNADAGSRQIVVSWTGEEVEYYSGMTTSASMVALAFKLQGFRAWRFMASSGRSWLNAQIWMPAVLILALIGVPLGCFIDLSRSRRAPAVTVTQAPASPLNVGASGVLNDTEYKITGHELLEMAEMGRRWQRHQYDLNGPGDNEAWLICDPSPTGPVWLFYSRLQPDERLTPQEAGAMRAGQKVNLDGSAVAIRELFRCTVRFSEGGSVFGGQAGDVFYGFTGQISSNRVLLVRWNQTNIIYQQGIPVPARTVLTAFGQVAGDQAPGRTAPLIRP
jgi:hypothetical protein